MNGEREFDGSTIDRQLAFLQREEAALDGAMDEAREKHPEGTLGRDDIEKRYAEGKAHIAQRRAALKPRTH